MTSYVCMCFQLAAAHNSHITQPTALILFLFFFPGISIRKCYKQKYEKTNAVTLSVSLPLVIINDHSDHSMVCCPMSFRLMSLYHIVFHMPIESECGKSQVYLVSSVFGNCGMMVLALFC